MGFPGGSDGKASAYNAGDLGSIPGLGRSPGEGNGNPLQYSSKITAGGDRSHEIKRCLLLGRKAMTNLDSILKSRDIITLPTKVHLLKTMVFPVVMYGYESWTIEKAERQRIDAFNCGVGEDS